MNKHIKNLLVASGLLALGVTSANAAPITIGSMTVQDNQTLNTASQLNGGANLGNGGLTQMAANAPFNTSALSHSTSMAFLTGLGAANEGVNMGDDLLRGGIQVSLAGNLLQNVAGNDIWVSEAGAFDGPEAFMVRAYNTTTSAYSSWIYKFATERDAASGSADLFTGFDFLTDFGFGSSDLVSHIQIQNAIAADTVTGAGQGTVILGGGSGNTLTAGSLNAGGNVAYSSTRFDADIGYVFYAQAIPEPSTYAMMAMGLVMTAYGLKISRRKKQLANKA